MMLSIVILAVLGFCIALYVFLLERKVRQQPDYKAVCDLSDKISCTKPIRSPYGYLFYVSNGTAGVLLYAILAILAAFDMRVLVLIAAIVASLVSLFLAYLLYFKIKALCLLCTSLYIINFIILYLSITSFLKR